MSPTESAARERAAGRPAAEGGNARPGAVFRRAIQDNLPGILGWGLGYGLLLLAVCALYPAMKASHTLLGIAGSLNLLGSAKTSEDFANLNNFTTFGGYLGVMALNLAPEILAVFIVPQALGAVSREEERGTLDLLLAAPISRPRFLIEKTLAIIVSLVGILALMWAAIAVSTLFVAGATLPLLNLTAGIWHIMPISLAILSGSLLISVSVRTGRFAGGLIALVLLANFFWRAVLTWVDVPALAPFKPLTIFYYYRIVPVFMNGLNWPYDRTLLLLALALFLAALWQFQRRDLVISG